MIDSGAIVCIYLSADCIANYLLCCAARTTLVGVDKKSSVGGVKNERLQQQQQQQQQQNGNRVPVKCERSTVSTARVKVAKTEPTNAKSAKAAK